MIINKYVIISIILFIITIILTIVLVIEFKKNNLNNSNNSNNSNKERVQTINYKALNIYEIITTPNLYFKNNNKFYKFLKNFNNSSNLLVANIVEVTEVSRQYSSTDLSKNPPETVTFDNYVISNSIGLVYINNDETLKFVISPISPSSSPSSPSNNSKTGIFIKENNTIKLEDNTVYESFINFNNSINYNYSSLIGRKLNTKINGIDLRKLDWFHYYNNANTDKNYKLDILNSEPSQIKYYPSPSLSPNKEPNSFINLQRELNYEGYSYLLNTYFIFFENSDDLNSIQSKIDELNNQNNNNNNNLTINVLTIGIDDPDNKEIYFYYLPDYLINLVSEYQIIEIII